MSKRNVRLQELNVMQPVKLARGDRRHNPRVIVAGYVPKGKVYPYASKRQGVTPKVTP
jgi:hypothetical protein